MNFLPWIPLLSLALWVAEGIEWRRGNCTVWNEDSPCICSGTSNGRSSTFNWINNPKLRLEQLRRQYVNCTVVYGNLELTHIEVEPNNVTGEPDFASVDLSFLEHIEEVTGYVLIYKAAVERISLPSLKVVWGDERYEDNGIKIAHNPNLKTVSMPNLRSLEAGYFSISDNPLLCHLRDRISYWEILGRDFKDRLQIAPTNFQLCKAPSNCSATCGEHCWGPGDEECQIVYRSICPARCDSGMCFVERGETKCCDRSCAGGCYGEGKRKCTACANFVQDGECVEQCNGLTKYDRIKGITVTHDKKRYTYDRYCVEKCPEETLIQGDHCVVHCSPGYHHDADRNTRECEKCDGVCPKKCTLSQRLNARWFEDPNNRNCTVIEGMIDIVAHVFTNHMGDNKEDTIPPLTDEHLETLQSVRVITEFVQISAELNSPTTLGFLRNLEVIEGRRLYDQKYALVLSTNTLLRELHLQKLRLIRKGDVSITKNEYLCYADSIPYARVLHIKGAVTVEKNAGPEYCKKNGLVCAAACNQTLGCWGEGPSMCVACEGFKKHGECVSHCPTEGFFKNETSRECLACHEECETCSGLGDTNCGRCRRLAMRQGQRTQCVAECPKSHYRSGSLCLPCDERCYENGCTGPGSFAGPGGCDLCKFAFRLDNVTEQFQCIMAKEDPREVCRDNNLTNYYLSGGSSLADQYVCERCNSECVSCRQFGDLVEKSGCRCRNYELRSDVAAEKTRCVSDCGPGSMIEVERSEESAGVCRRCHSYCDQKKSCSGPFEGDCEACEYGILDAAGALKCLPECPPELPYAYDGLCREVDPKSEELKRRNVMYSSIVVILFATVIICGVLGYYAKKNRRLYKEELEMNPPAIPPQDPFDPAVEPNMSRLTIIPGENLAREPGEKLGEGAFGVVYKGYLYPKGKHARKVVVAIKHLKTTATDGSAEKEMLEEAGLMASMHHKHLLKIAGICLVDGVSIVSSYRKYGSLLEFLRKNQKYLYAKDLLLYCYQIADAMEYLHEHKMVHRDLAARNVLVKRTNYVEVTDFGLAKMLKKDEESVEVSGKVAPKWLAIECFEKRAFNEPTDVWAFGVTCWEVLTKGCVPYKNMAVDQMRRFLEDGNRLETPNNVSQELYSLLLLCWLSHPRTRPSFSQLKSKLEEFCRQPNRYLKDVNSKDMALSTRDRRIAESYSDPFAAGDSDDEPNDDPDFPGFPSESPRDSPPSPSKPLLPRNQRLQSRESERYDTDPVYKGRPGNSVRIVDDYLEPRGREAAQMNPAEIYTPVIDEETGRTELYNENAYYNEPAAQKKPLYENEALRAAPKDATYVNDEMRTVSNPCYVTDPVPQKETAL